MRTRNQIYADKAWEAISKLGKSDLNEFKRWADDFPTHIMKAGLAQALGFVRAKSNGQAKAATLYISAIRQMAVMDLAHLEIICPSDKDVEKTKIATWHHGILGMSLTKYMQTTQRVLQIAVWLKRIGQTELEVDKPASSSLDTSKESRDVQA